MGMTMLASVLAVSAASAARASARSFHSLPECALTFLKVSDISLSVISSQIQLNIE